MSEKLLKRLERKLESVNESLEKFQLDFAKDPAYALVWSGNTFKHAAEQRVLRGVVQFLKEGATVESLRGTLQSAVLHAAKYPPQSTSPTSNLMEQYELAVRAELLSDLEYFG